MYDVEMREKAKKLYKEGLSQQAIGTTLGVPRNTVRYWVSDMYREREATRRQDPEWKKRRKIYMVWYKATHGETIREGDEKYRRHNKKRISVQRKQYRIEHEEEIRLKDKAYYKQNKEKIKQKTARYREVHQAEVSARKRRYRDGLTDKQKTEIKAYMRDYVVANRERLRGVRKKYNRTVKGRAIKNTAQVRRRIAMKKGEGISSNALVALWEKQDGKCAYCGRQMSLEIGTNLRHRATIDHIVPLISDAKHVKENIVWVCMSCNASKRDLPVIEWLRKKHGPVRAALFKETFPEWDLRVREV